MLQYWGRWEIQCWTVPPSRGHSSSTSCLMWLMETPGAVALAHLIPCMEKGWFNPHLLVPSRASCSLWLSIGTSGSNMRVGRFLFQLFSSFIKFSFQYLLSWGYSSDFRMHFLVYWLFKALLTLLKLCTVACSYCRCNFQRTENGLPIILM